MAIERRWTAVAPVQFTASGTAQGLATIDGTSQFKVKMHVTLVHPSLPPLKLEVKAIRNDAQLELGEIGNSHNHRANLTQYDTQTTILALEQARPAIPVTDMDRASHEEEPANARRVIMVDRYGRIKDWEEFEVINDPSTHEPTKIIFKLKDGTVVREYTFDYDTYGDLISAAKKVP